MTLGLYARATAEADGEAAERSILTKGTSNRKAERPLNAILNLAFALATIECRLACETVGLHPALGFVHADEPRRDNLAMDLLETVRPAVEHFALALVAERTFGRRDFVERSDGSIRIAPDLVQQLAATMPMWAKTVAPYTGSLAHLLGRAVAGKWTARTPLTNSHSKAAQAVVKARREAAQVRAARSVDAHDEARRVDPAKAAGSFGGCVDCGGLLTRPRHIRCEDCWDGQASQSRATRRERGRAISAARAPQEAWRAEHPGAVVDRADFLAAITPRLKQLTLRQIMGAAGVTKSTASSYRNGNSVPHASYWPALARLVGVESIGAAAS